jgi:hypothetical protein
MLQYSNKKPIINNVLVLFVIINDKIKKKKDQQKFYYLKCYILRAHRNSSSEGSKVVQ